MTWWSYVRDKKFFLAVLCGRDVFLLVCCLRLIRIVS